MRTRLLRILWGSNSEIESTKGKQRKAFWGWGNVTNLDGRTLTWNGYNFQWQSTSFFLLRGLKEGRRTWPRVRKIYFQKTHPKDLSYNGYEYLLFRHFITFPVRNTYSFSILKHMYNMYIAIKSEMETGNDWHFWIWHIFNRTSRHCHLSLMNLYICLGLFFAAKPGRLLFNNKCLSLHYGSIGAWLSYQFTTTWTKLRGGIELSKLTKKSETVTKDTPRTECESVRYTMNLNVFRGLRMCFTAKNFEKSDSFPEIGLLHK